MKKLTILLLAATLCGCSPKMEITVFGQRFPEKDVYVGTDAGAAWGKTNRSGHVTLKVKRMPDSCYVYAWIPGDTARTMAVEKYFRGGGPVHLRIKDDE